VSHPVCVLHRHSKCTCTSRPRQSHTTPKIVRAVVPRPARVRKRGFLKRRRVILSILNAEEEANRRPRLAYNIARSPETRSEDTPPATLALRPHPFPENWPARLRNRRKLSIHIDCLLEVVLPLETLVFNLSSSSAISPTTTARPRVHVERGRRQTKCAPVRERDCGTRLHRKLRQNLAPDSARHFLRRHARATPGSLNPLLVPALCGPIPADTSSSHPAQLFATVL
jgi:hypothetical protein